MPSFTLCIAGLCADSGSAITAGSVEAGGGKYQAKKQEFNENTVVIVSGQTSGTYLKLAEELQNVLDRRDTNELRILPVVGTPGPQNILDVLFLRGVDMCMTETDYSDYFKGLGAALCGGIGSKINYIAKLYNTEFHMLARKDMTSLSSFAARRSISTRGSARPIFPGAVSSSCWASRSRRSISINL